VFFVFHDAVFWHVSCPTLYNLNLKATVRKFAPEGSAAEVCTRDDAPEVLNLKPFYRAIFIFWPNQSSTRTRPSLIFAHNDSCRILPWAVQGKNYLSKSRLGPKPITNMKFFIVLVSLFAAVQAQFSFGAPAPGSTIRAGQDVTVQIIVPIDTVSDIFCFHVGDACLPNPSRVRKQVKRKSAL
jgi:hypothetical protein